MSDLTRRGFIGTALSAGTALPALGTIALAQSPNPAQANVKVESDVVFGKGGDMDLKLDIYRPPAGVTPKRMATIHFHGGGFTGGNKESLSERVKPYAALGYVRLLRNIVLPDRPAILRSFTMRRRRSAGFAPMPRNWESSHRALEWSATPLAGITHCSPPVPETGRNLKEPAAMPA
jgi:hypothetical protein